MKKVCVWLIAVILFIAMGLYSAPVSESAPAVSFNYYIKFAYQSTNSKWWTGLAITNGSDDPNGIRVMVKNEDGDTVASGDFTFRSSDEQRVALLEDIVTTGTIPQRGSVLIYGAYFFSAVEIVGNESGGFGMSEQQAQLLPD